MIKRVMSLGLISFALASFVASAAPRPAPRPGDKLPVTIFQGVFTSEDGKTAQLRVADGGAIQITNRDLKLFYALAARQLANGKVELTLRQYIDAEHTQLMATDVFKARLDGRAHSSALAPFSVSLTGTLQQLASYRAGGPPKPSGPNLDYIDCCISCGGWELCCAINLGLDFDWICCEIGMCGWTCTICEWWEAPQLPPVTDHR